MWSWDHFGGGRGVGSPCFGSFRGVGSLDGSSMWWLGVTQTNIVIVVLVSQLSAPLSRAI